MRSYIIPSAEIRLMIIQPFQQAITLYTHSSENKTSGRHRNPLVLLTYNTGDRCDWQHTFIPGHATGLHLLDTFFIYIIWWLSRNILWYCPLCSLTLSISNTGSLACPMINSHPLYLKPLPSLPQMLTLSTSNHG